MTNRIRYRPPSASRVRCTASSLYDSRRPWRLVLVALGVVALSPGGAEAIQATDSSSLPGRAAAPAAPATPSFMWEGRTPGSERPRPAAAFIIEAAARDVLQDLWTESVRAKEERVGCIVGVVNGDGLHLTGAAPVPTEKADSLHVSPGPSLKRCGPPEWNGTVHTHIATNYRPLFDRFGGTMPGTATVRTKPAVQAPYSTFSQADRAVMAMWRARWGTEGVFCILYSESQAYCEYGTALHGDTFYADQSDVPSSP